MKNLPLMNISKLRKVTNTKHSLSRGSDNNSELTNWVWRLVPSYPLWDSLHKANYFFGTQKKEAVMKISLEWVDIAVGTVLHIRYVLSTVSNSLNEALKCMCYLCWLDTDVVRHPSSQVVFCENMQLLSVCLLWAFPNGLINAVWILK